MMRVCNVTHEWWTLTAGCCARWPSRGDPTWRKPSSYHLASQEATWSETPGAVATGGNPPVSNRFLPNSFINLRDNFGGSQMFGVQNKRSNLTQYLPHGQINILRSSLISEDQETRITICRICLKAALPDESRGDGPLFECLAVRTVPLLIRLSQQDTRLTMRLTAPFVSLH